MTPKERAELEDIRAKLDKILAASPAARANLRTSQDEIPLKVAEVDYDLSERTLRRWAKSSGRKTGGAWLISRGYIEGRGYRRLADGGS